MTREQLDCFLSGDDKCFAFLFHLQRLIFSVQSLVCHDGIVEMVKIFHVSLMYGVYDADLYEFLDKCIRK